jgi:hypothetical protein
MPEAVYRMLSLLRTLVVALPVGTNLGLLHLLWMLVSGRLLAALGWPEGLCAVRPAGGSEEVST